MAKKFQIAPGIEVLFNRSVEVAVTLPSGAVIKAVDTAPNVYRFEVDGEVTFGIAPPAGPLLRVQNADEAAIQAEFDAAEVSKRAPK